MEVGHFGVLGQPAVLIVFTIVGGHVTTPHRLMVEVIVMEMTLTVQTVLVECVEVGYKNCK